MISIKRHVECGFGMGAVMLMIIVFLLTSDGSIDWLSTVFILTAIICMVFQINNVIDHFKIKQDIKKWLDANKVSNISQVDLANILYISSELSFCPVRKLTEDTEFCTGEDDILWSEVQNKVRECGKFLSEEEARSIRKVSDIIDLFITAKTKKMS